LSKVTTRLRRLAGPGNQNRNGAAALIAGLAGRTETRRGWSGEHYGTRRQAWTTRRVTTHPAK
jgi:hypothetical protein